MPPVKKEDTQTPNESGQTEPMKVDPEAVSTGRKAAPTETSKSEVKVKAPEEDETPQSYVWLANGEVLLVNDEDLPGAAGSDNPHGHWVKDGNVFQVVAVYAKEEKAEE